MVYASLAERKSRGKVRVLAPPLERIDVCCF
jgi:hypothetical protein